MAGHSKWANIKHKKAKADKKKGKLFSKIMKELINAVKQGGADPKTNARLRVILDKARAAGMPQDNIDRNIKRAASQDSTNYDEVIYEIYGYGGVAILCEALTDNKNRTATDIRIAINKRGGQIASVGSVLFLFDRKGVIEIAKAGVDKDQLFFDATDRGAEDFDEDDTTYYIITTQGDFAPVRAAIEEKGYAILQSTLTFIPKARTLSEGENREKNQALIEWLEEIDDVDEVISNMVHDED